MIIKLATTAAELNQVFRLRYEVYVKEEGKFNAATFPGKMISDQYDLMANTINLLLIKDGIAAGTVRLTNALYENEKLPADKLYNFDSIRKKHSGQLPACIGMLAIRKNSRGGKSFSKLINVLFKLLLTHDYYIFTLNHECSRLICRAFGAKILADRIWSDEVRNFIIPMILYKDQVISYLKKVGAYEYSTIEAMN